MHILFENQFLKFLRIACRKERSAFMLKISFRQRYLLLVMVHRVQYLRFFVFTVHIDDLPSLMDNSAYLFADETQFIGSRMNLFLLQNDLKKLSNGQKETSCISTMEILKICFDMRNLDQCSVHLYADDTNITCKASVNDLGTLITNNLK